MSRSVESDRFSTNGHERFNSNLIPGQIEVEVPGLVASESVSAGIKKGKIGELIRKLHDEEKHIVALRRPGKMILYVGASIGVIGAIAGGVYLRSKRK